MAPRSFNSFMEIGEMSIDRYITVTCGVDLPSGRAQEIIFKQGFDNAEDLEAVQLELTQALIEATTNVMMNYRAKLRGPDVTNLPEVGLQVGHAQGRGFVR